jgi:hypothetical protein
MGIQVEIYSRLIEFISFVIRLRQQNNDHHSNLHTSPIRRSKTCC